MTLGVAHAAQELRGWEQPTQGRQCRDQEKGENENFWCVHIVAVAHETSCVFVSIDRRCNVDTQRAAKVFLVAAAATCSRWHTL